MFKKYILATLDWGLLIISPLIAVISLLLARGGSENFPHAFKMWDRLGVSPIRHHYYQPIFNPGKLPETIWTKKIPLYSISWNAKEQLELLERFCYQEELSAIPTSPTSTHLDFYHNQSFGPADAEMLYNIVRHYKPGTVIEIGSGYSTRMMKKALDVNRVSGIQAKHICIEPYEMSWLESLGVDEVIRFKVEDINIDVFEKLANNDILFIDSSHVIRTGGDVYSAFFHILPILKKGVLIHIHDIFLPYQYPKEWVVTKRRFWTEQYLLIAFLMYNSDFQILSAVNWLATEHHSELAKVCPIYAQQKRGHGSFWLRKS